MKKGFLISALSVIGTIGVAAGAVAIVNNAPSTKNKLSVSWGDSILFGGNKQNTNKADEIDSLNEYCKTNHAMLVYITDVAATESVSSSWYTCYSQEDVDNILKSSNSYNVGNYEVKHLGYTYAADSTEYIEELKFEEKAIMLYSQYEKEIYPYVVEIAGKIQGLDEGDYMKVSKTGKVELTDPDLAEFGLSDYTFKGWACITEAERQAKIDTRERVIDLSTFNLSQVMQASYDDFMVFSAVIVDKDGNLYTVSD